MKAIDKLLSTQDKAVQEMLEEFARRKDISVEQIRKNPKFRRYFPDEKLQSSAIALMTLGKFEEASRIARHGKIKSLDRHVVRCSQETVRKFASMQLRQVAAINRMEASAPAPASDSEKKAEPYSLDFVLPFVENRGDVSVQSLQNFIMETFVGTARIFDEDGKLIEGTNINKERFNNLMKNGYSMDMSMPIDQIEKASGALASALFSQYTAQSQLAGLIDQYGKAKDEDKPAIHAEIVETRERLMSFNAFVSDHVITLQTQSKINQVMASSITKAIREIDKIASLPDMKEIDERLKKIQEEIDSAESEEKKAELEKEKEKIIEQSEQILSAESNLKTIEIDGATQEIRIHEVAREDYAENIINGRKALWIMAVDRAIDKETSEGKEAKELKEIQEKLINGNSLEEEELNLLKTLYPENPETEMDQETKATLLDLADNAGIETENVLKGVLGGVESSDETLSIIPKAKMARLNQVLKVPANFNIKATLQKNPSILQKYIENYMVSTERNPENDILVGMLRSAMDMQNETDYINQIEQERIYNLFDYNNRNILADVPFGSLTDGSPIPDEIKKVLDENEADIKNFLVQREARGFIESAIESRSFTFGETYKEEDFTFGRVLITQEEFEELKRATEGSKNKKAFQIALRDKLVDEMKVELSHSSFRIVKGRSADEADSFTFLNSKGEPSELMGFAGLDDAEKKGIIEKGNTEYVSQIEQAQVRQKYARYKELMDKGEVEKAKEAFNDLAKMMGNLPEDIKESIIKDPMLDGAKLEDVGGLVTKLKKLGELKSTEVFSAIKYKLPEGVEFSKDTLNKLVESLNFNINNSKVDETTEAVDKIDVKSLIIKTDDGVVLRTDKIKNSLIHSPVFQREIKAVLVGDIDPSKVESVGTEGLYCYYDGEGLKFFDKKEAAKTEVEAEIRRLETETEHDLKKIKTANEIEVDGKKIVIDTVPNWKKQQYHHKDTRVQPGKEAENEEKKKEQQKKAQKEMDNPQASGGINMGRLIYLLGNIDNVIDAATYSYQHFVEMEKLTRAHKTVELTFPGLGVSEAGIHRDTTNSNHAKFTLASDIKSFFQGRDGRYHFDPSRIDLAIGRMETCIMKGSVTPDALRQMMSDKKFLDVMGFNQDAKLYESVIKQLEEKGLIPTPDKLGNDIGREGKSESERFVQTFNQLKEKRFDGHEKLDGKAYDEFCKDFLQFRVFSTDGAKISPAEVKKMFEKGGPLVDASDSVKMWYNQRLEKAMSEDPLGYFAGWKTEGSSWEVSINRVAKELPEGLKISGDPGLDKISNVNDLITYLNANKTNVNAIKNLGFDIIEIPGITFEQKETIEKFVVERAEERISQANDSNHSTYGVVRDIDEYKLGEDGKVTFKQGGFKAYTVEDEIRDRTAVGLEPPALLSKEERDWLIANKDAINEIRTQKEVIVQQNLVELPGGSYNADTVKKAQASMAKTLNKVFVQRYMVEKAKEELKAEGKKEPTSAEIEKMAMGKAMTSVQLIYGNEEMGGIIPDKTQFFETVSDGCKLVLSELVLKEDKSVVETLNINLNPPLLEIGKKPEDFELFTSGKPIDDKVVPGALVSVYNEIAKAEKPLIDTIRTAKQQYYGGGRIVDEAGRLVDDPNTESANGNVQVISNNIMKEVKKEIEIIAGIKNIDQRKARLLALQAVLKREGLLGFMGTNPDGVALFQGMREELHAETEKDKGGYDDKKIEGALANTHTKEDVDKVLVDLLKDDPANIGILTNPQYSTNLQTAMIATEHDHGVHVEPEATM